MIDLHSSANLAVVLWGLLLYSVMIIWGSHRMNPNDGFFPGCLTALPLLCLAAGALITTIRCIAEHVTWIP